MADKNLRIKISAELQNKGISELRTLLKATQQEMDKLVQSGGRGSQAFNDLKTRAGVLSQTINGLSREFRGLDKDVKMSGMALFELFENTTVVTAGVVQAFSKIKETVSDFIGEFNKLQSAKLGLESIAKFKGVDETATLNSIKNLDLVKNGLLNIGDASLSLKNLLASGFDLNQSIELIKRLGDAAAFGRQSSLEFGYAIASATEGIKNQNSMLVDNAGVTKNLSVILTEAGFSQKDLAKVSTDAKVRMALYNGILKETNGQLGDASKLTNTFAGQQASLNATILSIKQRFGELLSQAIQPFFNFLKDGNGNFSNTLVIFTGAIGIVAQLIPLISALRIAFQGLQLSMGWISIIGIAIAGLITGLGLLANKVDESAHKIEDLDNRIQNANDNVKKYSKSISDATIILKGYHAEINNTKLNTSEQNQYNEALSRLKNINPQLVEQIKQRTISENDLKNSLEGVTKESQNLYQANVELLNANKNLKISELGNDYKDVTKEVKELNAEFEKNKKALETGFVQEAEQVYSSLTNTMVTQSKTVKLTAEGFEQLKHKQDEIISKLGVSQGRLRVVISDIIKTHLIGKDVSKDWANVVNSFAERLRGLGINTGNLINVFRQLGATGVASIFGISSEMLNNAKISQSLSKAWSLFTAGKYEEAKNEFLNTLKQASEYKPKTTNLGGSDKKGKSEEEKITTDLSRLQEELKNTKAEFELLKKELTAQGVIWDENTISIKDYANAISDLETQIEFKKLNLKDLKLPDVVDLPKFDNSTEIKPIEVPIELTARIQEQDKKKAGEERESIISSEAYQNTLMVFDSMGDALRNSLNNAWSDTFGEANSLFEQFMQNVTTALINSLITKAISGLLNIIFPGSGVAFGAIAGKATGGEVQESRPYWVGERGKELFVPQMNGRILNHSDSMKTLTNQTVNNTIANQPQVIEKYFALEQDGVRLLEVSYPRFKSKKNFRQL